LTWKGRELVSAVWINRLWLERRVEKLVKWRVYLLAATALLSLGLETALAELAGHGGPVRALAISPDGKRVVSGSFDTSAILWSLATESADQVLRFHSDAVNAVAFLPDGRIATAGADARIAIWSAGRQQPDQVLEGHGAPIAGLAVSPDGSTLASASWDSTVRLWPLRSGATRVLQGHTQNVNGVAFTPDGSSVVSVGYDLTVRIWPLKAATPEIITLPSPLNAVAAAPDRDIVTAGADGWVRLISPGAKPNGAIQAAAAPIVALAVSSDGALIAAAAIDGTVSIIDRKARLVTRTLGAGSRVWSLAFLPRGSTLLTGGADGVIRQWNALSGEPLGSALKGTQADPLASYSGEHGAEIFRACVACHTLSDKETPRAGPSLAGLFGRKIASLPGYRFSEALKDMNIVWTPETVSKLFELGPNTYTPGTKMPEQRISSPDDRKALTDFLTHATRR
jgi:cytochrome c